MASHSVVPKISDRHGSGSLKMWALEEEAPLGPSTCLLLPGQEPHFLCAPFDFHRAGAAPHCSRAGGGEHV